MPKIPGMKWGALLNWVPEDAEMNSLLNKAPFPEDGKWHSIIRDPTDNKNKIIDGHVIRQSDDKKLT